MQQPKEESGVNHNAPERKEEGICHIDTSEPDFGKIHMTNRFLFSDHFRAAAASHTESRKHEKWGFYVREN